MKATITEAELIELRASLAAAERKAEAMQIHSRLKELKRDNRPGASLTLAKLSPVMVYGGLLHGTDGATSDQLSTASRPWRRLIAALRLPPDHPDRIIAERLLHELDVKYFDGDDATGKGNRRLFVGPGDTPDVGPMGWRV